MLAWTLMTSPLAVTIVDPGTGTTRPVVGSRLVTSVCCSLPSAPREIGGSDYFPLILYKTSLKSILNNHTEKVQEKGRRERERGRAE